MTPTESAQIQMPVWLTVTVPQGTDPAKIQQAMEPYLVEMLEVPQQADDTPFAITNLEVGAARLVTDA